MINFNKLSPFVRSAINSCLVAPYKLNTRILSDYELIFLEKGKFKLTMGDKVYICDEGDVVFIRPNQQHKIECIDKISVLQPHIHFDMIYDEYSEKVKVSFKNLKYFSNEEKKMIREDVFLDSNLKSPILKVTNKELILSIFYDIINIFNEKQAFYQLKCKERMLNLLYYLFKYNLEDESRKNRLVDDVIYQLKDYIDNNANSTINLESLSNQFHYNKYYLEKTFKKVYGMSIIKYYNEVRLTQAKSLLLSLNSITAVAEKLSFVSRTTFSRFFKLSTGMTPTEFIDKNKEIK